MASALEYVAVVESHPRRKVRRLEYGPAYARPTAAAVSLLSVVRRRDRDVALWLMDRTALLLNSDPEARVTAAAETAALLRLWQMEPGRIRKRAAEERAATRQVIDRERHSD